MKAKEKLSRKKKKMIEIEDGPLQVEDKEMVEEDRKTMMEKQVSCNFTNQTQDEDIPQEGEDFIEEF